MENTIKYYMDWMRKMRGEYNAQILTQRSFTYKNHTLRTFSGKTKSISFSDFYKGLQKIFNLAENKNN